MTAFNLAIYKDIQISEKQIKTASSNGIFDFKKFIYKQVPIEKKEQNTPKDSRLVSWADATDQQIVNICSGFYADEISLEDIQEYWHVGDTRKMTLYDIPAYRVNENNSNLYRFKYSESHREQEVELVILDFEHDTSVSDINGHTQTLVTVGIKDILVDADHDTHRSSMYFDQNTNTENGGLYRYDFLPTVVNFDSRWNWLYYVMNVYQSSSYFANTFKTVSKAVWVDQGDGAEIKTMDTKGFLLAEAEILPEPVYSTEGEGYQYSYFALAEENKYKYPKYSSSEDKSAIYWTRSPYLDTTTDFCIIDQNGNAGHASADNSYGLSFAFCL